MGYGYKESCRNLFKELKILTPCYCSLLIIGVTLFQIVYSMKLIPDKKNDLHLPQVSLAMYQKGVYYSGIEIFNGLAKQLRTTPASLKSLNLL